VPNLLFSEFLAHLLYTVLILHLPGIIRTFVLLNHNLATRMVLFSLSPQQLVWCGDTGVKPVGLVPSGGTLANHHTSLFHDDGDQRTSLIGLVVVQSKNVNIYP
jgi:hypothetical protein